LGDGSSSGSLNPASPVSITGGTFAINQDDTVTQGTDFSGAAITGSGTFAVKGGATVALTNPATFSDLLTVSVAADSFLDLNFTGTDTIAGLNLGAGPVAPGEWGANGSGAANQSARITGSGRLYIPGAPTWDGSTDMTWTSPDSTSWSGNTYMDGDFVTFGDTGAGAVTITGIVTPSSVTVNSTVAYSFSGGAIGGSTGFVHSGSGTTTLSNANTYTGVTTVSAGTLQIKNSTALGTTAGNTIVATNAKVHLDGSAGNLIIAEPLTIGGGLGVIRNLSGANNVTGSVTLSTGVDLRRNGGSLTMSGGVTSGAADYSLGLNLRAIIDTNPIDINNGSLTITSNGGAADATEINVAGNDWGQTAINFSGYLKIGVADALPADTAMVFGWFDLGQHAGAFDLNGNNQTLASIATRLDALGEVPAGGAQVITGGGTLTVDQATNTEYQGVITDGTTATSLVKNGVGALTLSGVNSHTGNTTINGGTLALSATANLSSDSGVRINTGGLLNLATGLNITVKSLVINGGAPLANGTYGSSTSGATNAGLASPDSYFAGTGILTVSSGGDYGTWAITKGIPGEPASGDYENDGISNLVEYALGTDPKVSTQPAGVYSGNTITFTKGADAIANGDVSWIIETSELLSAGSWTPQVTQPAGDATPTISHTFTLGSPARNFARLKVIQN
jgi:autotransporter-associated beta strand protein